MKAKLKTELVRVQYWQCAISGHRHTTEGIANTCIERELDMRARMKSGKKHVWDRLAIALLLSQFRSGISKAELGRQYSVTGSMIGSCISKAERLERAVKIRGERASATGAVSIDKLPLTVRTLNCLWAENIYSMADLLGYSEQQLLKLPNIGRKSINEVREVLAEAGIQLFK